MSGRPKVAIKDDKITVGAIELSANGALITARKLVAAAVNIETSTPACRANTIKSILHNLLYDLLYFYDDLTDEPPPGAALPVLVEPKSQEQMGYRIAASKVTPKLNRNLLNVLLGKEDKDESDKGR
jgi:hypothetical protein